MDRVRGIFSRKAAAEQEYEPLHDGQLEGGDQASSYLEAESEAEAIFSWIEYSIFALIGVAMLWAWYAPLPLSGKGRPWTDMR